MSRSFNRSVNRLLGIEGGYTNHPDDRGGKTNFGITESLAEEYGFNSVEDITEEDAREIYKEEFWDSNQLDEVAKLSEQVAFQIFEIAVNASSSTAIKFFQRSLNCFNNKGEIFSDIEVDGIVGDETIGAWVDFHNYRKAEGNKVMESALNSLQGAFYVHLTEEDDSYETFSYGWFLQRITENF